MRGVMLRRWMACLCVAGQLGCSAQATLPGAQVAGISEAREGSDGTVRLTDDQGNTVHLRADDKLKVTTTDGVVTSLLGQQVCRGPEGLSVRPRGASCAQAQWLAAWPEIASIEVEQFDGASSVAIATVAAIVVVGVVVVALASAGDSKSSPKIGGKPSSHTPASPSVGPSKPSPAPAPRGGADAPVAVAPHRHHHHSRSSTTVIVPQLIFVPSGGGSSTASTAPDDPDEPSSQLSPEEARPLFSDQARRRSIFSPSLRAEVGACLGGATSCSHETFRLGALLGDFVELSGGLRVEQRGARSSLLAALGLGLQGRFPGVPSLALALGSQASVGLATRVSMSAGLRGHLGQGFWLGFQPLGATYFVSEGALSYTPSLDLAYAF